MIKMKKELYICSLVFGLLFLAGCNKWLDVKPEDKFIEEQLYSNPQGFADAINGFYIKNGDNGMYGGTLTMTTMDVLAQLYAVSSGNAYYPTSVYSYGDKDVKSGIDKIWTNMYLNIASANKYIQSLDTYGSILDAKTRARYQGEAYGLRAFYYFDLVRMFTKTYTTADSTRKYLPYYDKLGKDISDFKPTSFVMQKILEDLSMAEQLLLENDPAVSQSMVSRPTEGVPGRNSRNYQMNYYAVRALKARVYLWKGDKASALREAKFLISNQSKFPWVTVKDLNVPATCNKIFSTEVIFAVENPKLNDLFNTVFSPTIFDTYILAGNSSGTFINKTIFENLPTDYRSQYSWKVAGKPYPTFFKYQDVSSDILPANRTVPLIRMGEMYLIAAECEPGLTEALGYLNELRIHRNTAALPSSTSQSQLIANILKEYRREFYGEGQLFFYYKRTLANSIVAAATNASLVINPDNYIFPIPLSETSPR
jgi:hypothetical protein